MINKIKITTLKEKNQKIVNIHYLKSKNGRNIFTTKHDGHYLICVKNKGWKKKDKSLELFVYIKINSENMDKPDLSKLIQNKDITAIQSKIQKIIKKVVLNFFIISGRKNHRSPKKRNKR